MYEMHPTATLTSVKSATVFYYIRAKFLLSTCHSCMYVTAMKEKSSLNATIAFVSYAYKLDNSS